MERPDPYEPPETLTDLSKWLYPVITTFGITGGLLTILVQSWWLITREHALTCGTAFILAMSIAPLVSHICIAVYFRDKGGTNSENP